MINYILETIYMNLLSIIIAMIIGIPLGITLFLTQNKGLSENKLIFRILDFLVINITRSIPFVILIVILIPLSRLIVGKSYGTNAFIIPLSIGMSPFIARIIENALNSIDKGLIELGLSIGATKMQIIFKILIPEAMPDIINGLTLSLISLIGYSTIAGIIGGGGLGDMAIIEGFQRGNKKLMYIATFLLILLVQIVQYIGSKIVLKIEEKRGKK